MKTNSHLQLLTGAGFRRGSAPLALTALVAAFVHVSTADAKTVTWGSEFYSTFTDSFGNSLDEQYYFQVGFFEDTFAPTDQNTDEWSANWRVFSQAVFDVDEGYFTSTATLLANGSVFPAYSGPDTVGTDFTGKNAYLWAFNKKTMDQSSQWLLARDQAWVFPEKNTTCCDNDPPVQWSVSDLNDDTPIWGGRSANTGSGYVDTRTPSSDLQLFRVIPEPVSALMFVMGGCLTALRRRR